MKERVTKVNYDGDKIGIKVFNRKEIIFAIRFLVENDHVKSLIYSPELRTNIATIVKKISNSTIYDKKANK